MDESYNIWMTTNKENTEIFSHYLISMSNLQTYYDKARESAQWVSSGGGAYSSIDGSSEDYLFVPKNGLLKFHFDKKGENGTMMFSAVEKVTLNHMVSSLGISVKEVYIHKGLRRIYSD